MKTIEEIIKIIENDNEKDARLLGFKVLALMQERENRLLKHEDNENEKIIEKLTFPNLPQKEEKPIKEDLSKNPEYNKVPERRPILRQPLIHDGSMKPYSPERLKELEERQN